MKNKLMAGAVLALLAALHPPLSPLHAQTTAFTYQGHLTAGGNVANGSYDLTFALYAAASTGTPQGPTLTNFATAVSSGRFTVTLDFGNEFPGAARWLELGVRTNGGGAFTPLTPRQPITPTPYAIYAAGATTATTATTANSVAAANIAGALAFTQLPANLVTNGQRNVALAGSFTGDGAGLTNLPGGSGTTYTNEPTGLPGVVTAQNGIGTNLSPLLTFTQVVRTATSNNYVFIGAGTVAVNTNFYPLALTGTNGIWTNSANGLMLNYTTTNPNSAKWTLTDGGVRLYHSGNAINWTVDTGAPPAPTGALIQYPYTIAVLSTNLAGLLQAGQYMTLYSNQQAVFDLGGYSIFQLGNLGSNGMAFAVWDTFYRKTNMVLALQPGEIDVVKIRGSGSTLTNTGFQGTQIPFTHAPRGIANYNDYYLVPGGTPFTGPDEPGEQVMTNALLCLATNAGLIACNNNWVRLDFGWTYSRESPIVADAGKFPSGMPYLTSLAHSLGIKVQGELLYGAYPAQKTAIPQAVADCLGLGFDGVGILHDINHSSPGNYITMEELREIIKMGNEGRWLANAQYNGVVINHNAAFWTSVNLLQDTTVFMPPEMALVNFFGYDPGYAKSSTREIADHVRTNALNFSWWTCPGHYPHQNLWQGGEFNNYDTNLVRQYLSASLMADAGWWMFTSDVHYFLPYLTNAEFYAWYDDPASHGGFAIYSNSLAEVWQRPIGDPGSGTNVFLLINSATGSTATVSFNVTNWSGGASNTAYIVRDIWKGMNIATFTNVFSTSVTQTNMLLVAVFPAAISGVFAGNGNGLTSLNAANLMGSIPAAALTAVPAGNLTGTVPLAQLPAAVVTNGASGLTLAGTFTGDGSGLTNLNPTKLGSLVTDARLSANVALRTGGNTFTGSQQVMGDVKLGGSGQYFVPGGDENLRLVRGIVRGTTAAGLNKGTGWSVDTYGGITVIKFASSFKDLPAVTVTAENAREAWHFSVVVALNSVTVTARRADGSLFVNPFHFTAIGPR